MKGASDSPCNENLFKVREPGEEKLLPEEQASNFHYTVGQLVFLAMRAMPDIQTPVSFLTKHVRAPDEDDWGKLK